MSERTDHGFTIGAIEVVAMAETNGTAAVRVQIGRTTIDVQASPKGRRVFVAIDDGDAGVTLARLRKGEQRWR